MWELAGFVRLFLWVGCVGVCLSEKGEDELLLTYCKYIYIVMIIFRFLGIALN